VLRSELEAFGRESQNMTAVIWYDSMKLGLFSGLRSGMLVQVLLWVDSNWLVLMYLGQVSGAELEVPSAVLVLQLV
jgi:hypothetical protein